MVLKFKCPHCAAGYALDEASNTSSLVCQNCGQNIQAPGSGAPGKLVTGLPPDLTSKENDMLLVSPARYLNQVTRHVERTIGRSPMVFHELVSNEIHLDLHIIPPRPEATPAHPAGRNYYTIVTSGMSARPMTRKPNASPQCPRFAELMISLPADWPGLLPDGTFVQEEMRDEANWWPIRWLKMLAAMTHEQGLAISPGDTIPHGAAAEPFAADTRLGCMLLLPSVLQPESAQLVVHDDITIHFLALWPLYPEEMEYKLRYGVEALQALLARQGVTDLLNCRRPSVVTAP